MSCLNRHMGLTGHDNGHDDHVRLVADQRHDRPRAHGILDVPITTS